MTQEEIIPMDTLARVYIRLRSKIATLTQEYEAKVERLQAQKDVVANAMKDQMLALKSTSLKTENGHVILSKHTKYWASDWDSMYQFMVQNNCPYLLEKRIAQKAMAAYLADHPNTLPGGLNSQTEFEISVRKPTQ